VVYEVTSPIAANAFVAAMRAIRRVILHVVPLRLHGSRLRSSVASVYAPACFSMAFASLTCSAASRLACLAFS
jgi:hypothetical protein